MYSSYQICGLRFLTQMNHTVWIENVRFRSKQPQSFGSGGAKEIIYKFLKTGKPPRPATDWKSLGRLSQTSSSYTSILSPPHPFDPPLSLPLYFASLSVFNKNSRPKRANSVMFVDLSPLPVVLSKAWSPVGPLTPKYTVPTPESRLRLV